MPPTRVLRYLSLLENPLLVVCPVPSLSKSRFADSSLISSATANAQAEKGRKSGSCRNGCKSTFVLSFGSFADVQGRSNNRPAAKQLPGATKPSAPPGAPAAPSMPTGGAAAARPVPKPALGGGAGRAPPPPPAPPAAPPAPARPAKQMYKALYAFTGQEGEVALVKGELVEVKEKDENGMFPRLLYTKLTSRMVEGTQEWSRGLGTC
jgi:hypothetical protein